MGEDVFHVLICSNDPVAREIYKTYIMLFSKELNWNIDVQIYSYQDYELRDIISSCCLFELAILEIQEATQKKEMEIAKNLLKEKKELPIIYITDSDSFRMQVSALLGIGVLSKTVDQQEFRVLYYRAVGQALLLKQLEYKKYLELDVNKKKIFIKLYTIVCLEKIQKKILFVTHNNIYEERNTIVSVMTRLPPYFLQISQSVVVNMNEIICIEGREVYMTTHKNYVIGRTFQKQVELCYRRFAR